MLPKTEFEEFLKRLSEATSLEEMDSLGFPDGLSAKQRQRALEVGDARALWLDLAHVTDTITVDGRDIPLDRVVICPSLPQEFKDFLDEQMATADANLKSRKRRGREQRGTPRSGGAATGAGS